MAGCRRYIIGFCGIWAALLSGGFAFAQPVFLQTDGGSTAFSVDRDASEAYWILDECRRKLPMQPQKMGTNPNTSTTMTSAIIRDDVVLGSRQVELRQQFRFHIGATEASVEVFNSVRGGWTPVPVRVDLTCTLSADCRERIELPECPGS